MHCNHTHSNHHTMDRDVTERQHRLLSYAHSSTCMRRGRRKLEWDAKTKQKNRRKSYIFSLLCYCCKRRDDDEQLEKGCRPRAYSVDTCVGQTQTQTQTQTKKYTATATNMKQNVNITEQSLPVTLSFPGAVLFSSTKKLDEKFNICFIGLLPSLSLSLTPSWSLRRCTRASRVASRVGGKGRAVTLKLEKQSS